MKYPPEIYASAFIDIATGKTKKEESALIENFLSAIKKNGDMAKIKRIFSATETMMRKKTGRKKWTLEIARPMKGINKFLKNIIGPSDITEEKINPEIIAGIKITEDEERQFDASLQKKLKDLFRN